MLHGFEESFRKEYGITTDAFVKWYHIREVLADLIDMKNQNIDAYEKWCKDNGFGYVILDNNK